MNSDGPDFLFLGIAIGLSGVTLMLTAGQSTAMKVVGFVIILNGVILAVAS